MKKTLIVLTAVVGGAFAAGYQGGKPSPDSVGGVVSDIRAQAADELRKAFVNEVEAFFESDDLTKTLGISSGEQGKLEASIKKYISEYSMDEEKLGEARESLEQLLENAQGLSAEELQKQIEHIFKEIE